MSAQLRLIKPSNEPASLGGTPQRPSPSRSLLWRRPIHCGPQQDLALAANLQEARQFNCAASERHVCEAAKNSSFWCSRQTDTYL
jgi:hypothetical protein